MRQRPTTRRLLQNAVDLSTDVNALASSANSECQGTDLAAEPSAGDAVSSVTGVASALDKIGGGQIPTVNGIVDAGSLGDVAVEDGSADVSVNSDTEGSRGDNSEHTKVDEKHHVSANSVKRPATFSKVSATRNFLAKSTASTPTAPKPGDKPSPVGTPPQPSAAKPRLVAKIGTSLRDVQKARSGGDGPSGPDASKVWNKNRRRYLNRCVVRILANNVSAAPTAPPKQFTDEELKQQYGIHLATRLQSSETGKESKWADIDDEEDDWAPEAVEWMDGTKSTLAPQEPSPLPKEQTLAAPQPTKPAEASKPPLMVQKPTELGPTKTILKPGANAAAVQARQGGSAAGTPTDRPSSKVKSPAPAPSKSPWALLPPVEKVSPINPPVQQQQQQQQPPPQPFVSQDARAYEQAPPPPPAREIAADTFDRSWREGEGGSRELFNSVNGRYEPAPEGRRSSIKPDSAYRKPAVLQRPSQSSGGPAEPSPAFQSRTSSQVDGAWGRRRGSSVSGSQGSIPPGGRMSISKGPEMSPTSERRPSIVIGHDMRSSPNMARTEPAPPVFAQQSAWEQQMPPRPEAGAEEEDPVKVQDRVMKEKRELARKRRQEDEEREEAEKQERLKARLAQLSGAGKSRKERDAEAAAAVKSPLSENTPDSAVPASGVDETQVQPAEPARTAAMVAPALESQFFPPAPETTYPKQPSPEEGLASPLPPKPQGAGLPDLPISSADQNQRQPSRPHLSPRANARAPFPAATSCLQSSSVFFLFITWRSQATAVRPFTFTKQ